MSNRLMSSVFTAQRVVFGGRLSLRRIGTMLLGLSAVLIVPFHVASAQQLNPIWVLSTLAGDGNQTASSGDGGPATSAAIGKPYSVVRDSLGNLYISDSVHTVRKVTPSGIISTIAGLSTQPGFTGDGGPATGALLDNPYGLCFDKDENLLIADTSNQVVRKIDSSGNITTIVGTHGKAGFGGDGGPATGALVNDPFTCATDRAGNLYIADYGNHRIRKVDTNGIITTFAGNGTSGNSGDGHPALNAEMKDPWAVSVDPAGNVYVADVLTYTVRMIDTGGIIHTIAGTGLNTPNGAAGLGGPATGATMLAPHGSAADGEGNVYITDENSHTIRRVDPSGIMTLIAGQLNPTTGAIMSGFAGDGGPGTAGKLWYPYSLAIDSSNTLYFADASNGRARELSLNTSLPSTAVGSSAQQSLFVTSTVAVTPVAGTITPSAPAEFVVGALSGCTFGSELAANTPCTAPITFQPTAPGLQTAQLAFTDENGKVSPIGLSGIGVAPQANFSLAAISTIAGNGVAGNAGAGGAAASSEVNAPRGGAIDSAGNIYFADSGNNIIRRIDAASGDITTVAGTGTAGYAGDGAVATAAQLNAPAKVVLDAAGDLYIADTGNNVIRFVDAATGFISTIAGTGMSGYTGDGGAATLATLNQPQGLAIDLGNHVYVADTGNNVIRYFGKGGQISTYTGTGTAGYSGDGSNYYGATLNAPDAVALGANGIVYIADTGNDVIRMVSSTNQISTFAGQQGNAANGGDGGAAKTAAIDRPSDIAMDAAGDLYIAAGGQVRMVNASGTITTLAGTGNSGNYSGEGGAATSATLPAPASNLMLDSFGNIVLADTAANRLLEIASASAMPLNLGIQAAGTSGSPTTFSVLNTGNSTLNISGIAATTGFTLQATGSSDCTSATSLAPGQSCLVGLVLSPPSTANGAVNGTLTLTDNNLNGTAATQTFVLAGATRTGFFTTTSVNISPASPVYGTSVSITATVNQSNNPTGTISFTSNGALIGNVTVSNSQASLTLSNLPAGASKIAATYSGDNNNTSSVGTGNVNIQPGVLTVTAKSATMSAGTTPSALTYSITGFVNGDTSSVVTGSPTEITAATPSSPQGSTYPIAISRGSLAAANYIFTFTNGTMTVGPPPIPDFLLSITPSTVNLSTSQTYVATVTLIPLYNYTGTVKLSCSSSPTGLGCTPEGTLTGAGGPLVGNAQGNPAYTQIAIGGGASSFSSSLALPGAQRLVLAFGMPVCFIGFLFGRKRKWVARVFGLALLAMLTTGVIGCGKSTTTAHAGTYQVTVTATDTSSSLSHTAVLAISFQQ